MKGNKIYISGKITGIEEQAKIDFAKTAEFLKGLGYEPINPMELDHNHDKTWESYMKVCIKAMMDCDCIYFFGNYADSQGALMEKGICAQLRIQMFHEKLNDIQPYNGNVS